MPDAASLGMISISELGWPVTYIWRISAPWGQTQQEFTVDCPVVGSADGATETFGELLWRSIVAPATAVSTSLTRVDVVKWKAGAFPVPYSNLRPAGVRLGLGSGRAQTPCLMLHSGHQDKYAMKPMFFPGAPSSWSSSGLLTGVGLGSLESLGHIIVMGMMNQWLGGPIGLLMAFRGAVDPEVGNPYGVAFRRVNFIRVCHHVERAPDPSLGF